MSAGWKPVPAATSSLPEVRDSLVVELEYLGCPSFLALEVPVRKLLLGSAPDKVASPDAMANPASLAFFVQLARQLNPA